MTTDILSNSAIDLVIFTVVDQSKLPQQLWDDRLVSYGPYKPQEEDGLGLFVVTVPADTDRYPNLKGQRVLPGGYLDKTMTLNETARAIAFEKLGLNLRTGLRQVGTFDKPDRIDGERVLSFAYWAMVDFEDLRKYLGGKDQIGLELVNSNTYMQAFEQTHSDLDVYDGVSRFGNRSMPTKGSKRWHFKQLTDTMPEGKILGHDHDEIVFYAWRRLRHAFDGKLDPFRFLGLNPLGSEFRLSELQEFQEVCRGDRMQRDLFRRQMLSSESFIKPSGKRDSSRPGKPAQLYNLDVEIPDTQIDDKNI